MTPYNYTPALNGCTHHDCGTQNTATVDGYHGRRCAQHPPVFDPDHAVHLAVELGPAAGIAYCQATLA